MKKSKKIVLIIMVAILIMLPVTVKATQINPNSFEPNLLQEDDVEELYQFGGSIAGAIQIVGTIVSVGVMMILGIRYMVASVEEKAEYKERMLPYVIGCVFLFGASNIVNIIYANVMDNNGTDRERETPQIILTWNEAQSAKEFIDGGGDLAEVDDETLKKWYGQLSRLAGNRGIQIEYYEKVKEECYRRGFWEEDNESSSGGVHKSSSGREHGGGGGKL